MSLEGVVTNVANFGAFVDIGVHQDGLVHISALADKFVKDPHEVVKAGDLVKVKVLEVDVKRKRIALTMRMGDAVGASRGGRRPPAAGGPGSRKGSPAAAAPVRPSPKGGATRSRPPSRPVRWPWRCALLRNGRGNR